MTEAELLAATDEQLMAGHMAGDDPALVLLWNGRKKEPRRVGYNVRVRGLLWRLYPEIPETDRDDITQDVMLKLVRERSKPTYKLGMLFRPWVFTVAINRANDVLRRRENRNQRGLEQADGTRLDPIQSSSGAVAVKHHSPIGGVGSFLTPTEDIGALLERLTDKERDVLVLRLEFNENKEVAAILDISEGEMSKRLNSALAKVKEAMNSDDRNSDSLSKGLIRQLRSLHHQALAASLGRMRGLELVLDKDGKLAGFTKAATRGDLEYILDNLRGVLPIYLLREGVDESHANEFYEYVKEHLLTLTNAQGKRFRDLLTGFLADYCNERQLAPKSCQDTAEFLHRLLNSEPESPKRSWVAEMKKVVQTGHIQTVDDLANAVKWPNGLWATKDKRGEEKETPFRKWVLQLHDSLLRVLRDENDLLNRAPQNQLCPLSEDDNP